jgi:hypothetical protein
MLYVVVLICAASVPREACDTHTARSYQAFTSSGIVCGLPGQAPMLTSAAGPSEGEYVRTKCVLKR